MCRLSSPLFGGPGFRRFSRDKFEQRLRQSSAFRQEGMGSGVIMSVDAESQLIRDGREEETHVTISRWMCSSGEPCSSRLWRGVNRFVTNCEE